MDTISQAFTANSSRIFKARRSKEAQKVYVTEDYMTFTLLEGNRDIHKENLGRIKISMQEKYIPVPIIVNEKHQIIDGQHRFTAARDLGLPIYYIVIPGLKLKDVQTLNTNTQNWGNKEFLESFCKMGYDDYLIFREFKNETGFNYGSCLALLTNSVSRSGQHQRDFEKGLFKVTDYKGGCIKANKIKELKEFFEEGFNSSSFITCMLKVFKNRKYNHKVFLRKLALQPKALKKQNGWKQYMQEVQEIYNYRTAEDNRVYFR